MPTSIADDDMPNVSILPADGAPSAAAGEKGLAAPSFAPKQEDPSQGLVSAITKDQHEIAVEAVSEAQSMPDECPSYPISVQAAQEIELQVLPTSSTQPLTGDGTNEIESPSEHNMAAKAQGDVSDGGAQLRVDKKPPLAPRKELPAFVQTSALIPNICGYCGTRSTSGCWRRGWEIGNGKFINLCNKCGLRHKAGKLQSVPQPSPSPNRRGAATAAGGGAARVSSQAIPAAAATAAASLTAAEREAAAANAAAAVAAAAGLPGSAAGELLRNLLEQQRGGGGKVGSLLAVAAANAAVDGDSRGGRDEAQLHRAKQKLVTLLEGLGFKGQGNDNQGLGHLANGGSSSRSDLIPPRLSSNVGTYGDYYGDPAAAAPAPAAEADHRPSFAGGHMDGLPDFSAAGSSRSNVPASAAISAFLAAAEAAADGSSSDVQGTGFDLGAISNMTPDFMQYLTKIATGEEPAAKRRRTKKSQGGHPVAAAAAAPAAEGMAMGCSRGAFAAAMDFEESLAVGAADALLTLNRSSPSGSPQPRSPSAVYDSAAAADADPFSPPIAYDQAAAAAAADKAAAAAERAAAAAATAAVDAAAGTAGWSRGPGNRMLDAFLSGALMGRTKSAIMPTATAAAAVGSGGRGSTSGNGGAADVSRQPLSRQVTTSPHALCPGTHALFPPPTIGNNNTLSPRSNHTISPASNLATSINNLTTPHASNLAISNHNPALATSISLHPLRNWTNERIYHWLHATGCNEAVRVFRDLDIDGMALAGLVRVAAADPARLHDVLKADLGVQHVGLRLRLVESIVALSAGEGM